MSTPEGRRESVHVSMRRADTLRRMEVAVDGVAQAAKTAGAGGGTKATASATIRLPNAQAPHLAVPNTGSVIRNWFVKHQEEKTVPTSKGKVPFFRLLQFSTTRERVYMVIGVIFAIISGFAMPVWLVLLARGLDKFSNLGFLIEAGVDLMEVVEKELNRLVISFAILGGVSLVSGSVYVSLWTYTGEQQAMRIMKRYVESCFHQDAEWFDAHDRNELPTQTANAMIHVRGAVGRQMADLLANGVASAGCLAVAFLLNSALALIMLAIVPVVALVILILAYFIRKASRQASESLASAGALATEVLAGIKTIAALGAESWAIRNYNKHVETAQTRSVWAGFWTGLSTGLTGFLFYCIYTVAFIFGTHQVAENTTVAKIV